MGLAGKPDVAAGIEEINNRLGFPASLRKIGYGGNDLGKMSEDALASHFNLAAPVVPTREEIRQIIAEILG